MTPEPSYRDLLRPETRERLALARKAHLIAVREAWRHIRSLVPVPAFPQVAEAVIAIAASRKASDTLPLCADLAALGVPWRLWARYIDLRDGHEKGEIR